MYEVNVKFKPEEWYGGYISKFATETAYNNAAFKLLPNVSKIGNNEIRYIPREEAHLPELYLYVDNIKDDTLFQESRDLLEYGNFLYDAYTNDETSDLCTWAFELIGQLKMGNNIRSLWKLCWKGYDNLDWSDCYYCLSQDYNTIWNGSEQDYDLGTDLLNNDEFAIIYRVIVCDKDFRSYRNCTIDETTASITFNNSVNCIVTCMSKNQKW